MISDFIQEKVNGKDKLERLVAINVSFWSRYLRNKDTVQYIDDGAPAPAKMMHRMAMAGKPNYSEVAVSIFEEVLFRLMMEQIQHGHANIDLSCDYDARGLLAEASNEALGSLYASKLSYSYKTHTLLDIAAGTIRYSEGYNAKSYNIYNVVDSSPLFLEGDL